MTDKAAQQQRHTFKETMVSIVIAFVLAFVFRAFVVEAFVIPTGSMAPTLMGAHMRFTSPQTGNTWAVGPWHYFDSQRQSPRPIQGPLSVHDPLSGEEIDVRSVPLRSGDRILVFKYLYSLYDPARWDVVVFKSPTTPQTNFIKRLVGLPNEQLALVDGDVFFRRPSASDVSGPEEVWSLPGWKIARKPERIQRAVWQPVFDSRFTPLNPMRDGRPWFEPPWRGTTPGWTIDGGSVYRWEGGGSAALAWDSTRRPIDDRYAYNEAGAYDATPRFPVGDLRLRAGVRPDGPGVSVSAVVMARGHEFRARLSAGGPAVLEMRELADGSPWKELVSASAAGALAPGAVTNVEFWHVDQSLQLWVDGKRVAYAEYDWSPAERIQLATGATAGDIVRTWSDRGVNMLKNPKLYRGAEPRWEFDGGAFTLHSVGLERDIYYQPGDYRHGPMNNSPSAATHPVSTPSLGPDHFFVCGDNSPQSEDARLWGRPDPWVSARIDPTEAVVPRDLLIGKAFFVYFPSLLRGEQGPMPVPDFGRLRFIW